ncbi:hypothetical protein GC105_09155 [Alkalibaculum sp. M08DMB]|uniref:Uncharacterized protein n=1 Tax=Alkalibaculum sporogenes TaxID=2655001 RepID=A0A6A7K9U2_9FIRM|nr:hypothetical protein [Alkalibaculum sporogenes]MPW25957.1 hypothetical protein [Alkalibaculum sporogenes]
MKYYRLLDPKNINTIVRAQGRSQQQYIKGKGWIESGILLDYQWPDSDTYDRYEEITELEALKHVGGIS